MENILNVGSMFAGIGGICLAFKLAGFNVVWANEKDNDACKTYRHNFGDMYLVEKDIRKIDAASIPNIDILTAGFPCQPFSAMGKQKGFSDPRGNLFFEISKIAKFIKPRIIFLENVKNIINHNDEKTFLSIYNELAPLGYAVKYKVMNVPEYGNIPQDRNRIYIVAFLNHDECDKFQFPEPIPLTTEINNILKRNIRHDDVYYYTVSNKYYSELNRKIIDKQSIYRIDDWGVAKNRYTICPTLKANMGTYHDRVPIFRDDFGLRKLTPRECLDFQGFPNDFVFKGISLASAYKQCGNSVCVPVVIMVMERLVAAINKDFVEKSFP